MNFSCYQGNRKSNGIASRREDRQTEIMHGHPALGPAQPGLVTPSLPEGSWASLSLSHPTAHVKHPPPCIPCPDSPISQARTTPRGIHPTSQTFHHKSHILTCLILHSHLPYPYILHLTWNLAWHLTLLRGSLTIWDLLLEIILGKRRRKRRRVRKGGANLPQDC